MSWFALCHGLCGVSVCRLTASALPGGGWRYVSSSSSGCTCGPQSRCRCERGKPSPGADVGVMGPVPVQMWERWAQSRCRCGKGEFDPSADLQG
jgi:hypothetical protein